MAEDGEASLVLAGTHDGHRIEISVQLQSGMLPSQLFSEPAQINAYPDGIRMRADAQSAKRLSDLLTEKYGLGQIAVSEPIDLSFTAVALEGDPRKVESEGVKFKLFHETGSSDDEEGPKYFEMFFNVNLGSGVAELNEKDTDFRIGILNALQAEAK